MFKFRPVAALAAVFVTVATILFTVSPVPAQTSTGGRAVTALANGSFGGGPDGTDGRYASSR